MVVFTDNGKREGGYLISEESSETSMRSRERGVLLSGTLGMSGMVCAAILAGAASAAAKSGGNTGNGTISAVTVQNGVKTGVYTVRFTGATTFNVEDPDGNPITVGGATGAAQTDDLGFTITVGGTPFVAGDGFDITVAVGSGKFRPLDTTALNGAQIAAAILHTSVDASLADKAAVFHVRACEVNDAELIWPAGISTPNKAAAIAALKAKGIIVR